MEEEHCRQETSKSLANLKFFSFFIAISLLSLSYSSLISASSYSLVINQVDNKALFEHEISLDSEQTISLSIPDDAASISSSSNYTISGNNLTIRGKSINLSYLTYSSLEKSKEGYYFVDNLKFGFPADSANIKLILDEGYFTESNSIFPKPSSVETDGSQIFLAWELNDIKAGDDTPVFVPIKAKARSWIVWLAWILIILVAGFVIFFVYDKLLKKAPKTKEDIDRYLIESEKAVLNILKQADRGEMWQKEVQLKANFSKAKLSRVIRNLESRNLVEKIPFGNTNKIRLK